MRTALQTPSTGIGLTKSPRFSASESRSIAHNRTPGSMDFELAGVGVAKKPAIPRVASPIFSLPAKEKARHSRRREGYACSGKS
jgi:hypothetical protein